MHRKLLLDQLSEYAVTHPDENDVIDRFVSFIENETRCFERSLGIGHITGSAWVVNEDGSKVLLTHHKKLNRWLQLGGHADGMTDVLAVAIKEAEEESGLAGFSKVGAGIFDIDIHPIPARKNEPEHLHYDVRYVLRPTGSLKFIVSEESHDLSWVDIDCVINHTTEESMMRMVQKWRNMR
ncbi:NUDIX hydrolase [Luteolibacter algae]|uniref:NUDIX hydrolase n=1 Tax=Luteolibacter algae TaxID=454151 RepID=A0ABW5D7L4_9BACT